LRKAQIGVSIPQVVIISAVAALAATAGFAQQSAMGTCTWIKGNADPRMQSCSIQHFNSGSLTVTTYKRNYVFEPYHSRGGYIYDGRIFQLHGDINSNSAGKTSFSLISAEANKQFRKLIFESEYP
tara:strand:+ start:615 stop:992 length:378 start_codon:yes stop_codon:yes gene_type:complete